MSIRDQVRVTFSIDERLRSLPPTADDPEFRDRVDSEYGTVSGHQLLTLQTFRNLFPRETIPSSESLLKRLDAPIGVHLIELATELL
ncbi:MAG: hypothetical protein KME06_07125 [Kastovskya adunca ATA6-11-RM4]|jgi:hypothetical protein|nr:hypothetical protein [Kastovskya adunca ATA6-11-RM4]